MDFIPQHKLRKLFNKLNASAYTIRGRDLAVGFRRLDSDRDAQLNWVEFQRVIRKQVKFEQHELRTLFEFMDSNRSGSIEFDDFVQFMQHNDGKPASTVHTTTAGPPHGQNTRTSANEFAPASTHGTTDQSAIGNSQPTATLRASAGRYKGTTTNIENELAKREPQFDNNSSTMARHSTHAMPREDRHQATLLQTQLQAIAQTLLGLYESYFDPERSSKACTDGFEAFMRLSRDLCLLSSDRINIFNVIEIGLHGTAGDRTAVSYGNDNNTSRLRRLSYESFYEQLRVCAMFHFPNHEMNQAVQNLLFRFVLPFRESAPNNGERGLLQDTEERMLCSKAVLELVLSQRKSLEELFARYAVVVFDEFEDELSPDQETHRNPAPIQDGWRGSLVSMDRMKTPAPRMSLPALEEFAAEWHICPDLVSAAKLNSILAKVIRRHRKHGEVGVPTTPEREERRALQAETVSLSEFVDILLIVGATLAVQRLDERGRVPQSGCRRAAQSLFAHLNVTFPLFKLSSALHGTAAPVDKSVLPITNAEKEKLTLQLPSDVALSYAPSQDTFAATRANKVPSGDEHYNPLKTHEEDIVEIYDNFCQCSNPNSASNNQNSNTSEAQQFHDEDGSSSNKLMKLGDFLWFLRDTGLTLPSLENHSHSVSDSGLRQYPALLTYSLASRTFEMHVASQRRIRSIIVSPFSDETSGAPYSAFRLAIREILQRHFPETSSAVGATTLERLFWENCVASLPCTDLRATSYSIRAILDDPVTIGILRQEAGPLRALFRDYAVATVPFIPTADDGHGAESELNQGPDFYAAGAADEAGNADQYYYMDYYKAWAPLTATTTHGANASAQVKRRAQSKIALAKSIQNPEQCSQDRLIQLLLDFHVLIPSSVPNQHDRDSVGNAREFDQKPFSEQKFRGTGGILFYDALTTMIDDVLFDSRKRSLGPRAVAVGSSNDVAATVPQKHSGRELLGYSDFVDLLLLIAARQFAPDVNTDEGFEVVNLDLSRLAPLYQQSSLAKLLLTMDPNLDLFSSLRRKTYASDLDDSTSQTPPATIQPLELTVSEARQASGRDNVTIRRNLMGTTEMLTAMSDEIRVQLQLLYSQFLCRFFPRQPLVGLLLMLRTIGFLRSHQPLTESNHSTGQPPTSERKQVCDTAGTLQAWDICEICVCVLTQQERSQGKFSPAIKSIRSTHDLKAFAGGSRDWTFVEFAAIIGSIVRVAQAQYWNGSFSEVELLFRPIASWTKRKMEAVSRQTTDNPPNGKFSFSELLERLVDRIGPVGRNGTSAQNSRDAGTSVPAKPAWMGNERQYTRKESGMWWWWNTSFDICSRAKSARGGRQLKSGTAATPLVLRWILRAETLALVQRHRDVFVMLFESYARFRESSLCRTQPRNTVAVNHQQLYVHRKEAHEFCRDYFQAYYDPTTKFGNTHKPSSAKHVPLSMEIVNDAFVAAASAASFGPRQAKLQRVSAGRVYVSQHRGDDPNSSKTRSLCLGFTEFVEFVLRVGFSLCFTVNDAARGGSMSRRPRRASTATATVPVAFEEFLTEVSSSTTSAAASTSKQQPHKQSDKLHQFVQSLLFDILDVSGYDASKTVHGVHQEGPAAEESIMLQKAVEQIAKTCCSESHKKSAAGSKEQSHLFLFAHPDRNFTRMDAPNSSHIETTRPKLANATEVLWQYFRPLDHSSRNNLDNVSGVRPAERLEAGTHPEIGFLDESWRGFLLLCIRAGLLDSQFSQIEAAQLVRQSLIQCSAESEKKLTKEPVGRFTPAQFRLCVTALATTALHVPVAKVMDELCQRLDHYLVTAHGQEHILQRREAIMLTSWASANTMASNEIAHKLRSMFLSCSTKTSTEDMSPRMKTTDVVWVLERMHLSPDFLSLSDINAAIQRLCGARDELHLQRNGLDFPTFLGIFEKITTTHLPAVSLVAVANLYQLQNNALRERRELLEHPNNYSATGEGTASDKFASQAVRPLPNAGWLEPQVLEQVLHNLQLADPQHTGVVSIDEFQKCLEPIHEAQEQAHALFEIGGDITAGQQQFWQRFRTRGGAVVDYFSYLQSVLVVHEGQGLPHHLCDSIVALTKEDQFPFSHLFRLYRHSQSSRGVRLSAFLALGMDCGIYDEGYLSMSNMKTIFSQCAVNLQDHGHGKLVDEDERLELDESAFSGALSRLAQLDTHRHSGQGFSEVGATAVWRRFAFYQEQSRSNLPSQAEVRGSYLEHNFVPWVIDDDCVHELLLHEHTLRAIFSEYAIAAEEGIPSDVAGQSNSDREKHGMQFQHFLAFAEDYRLCPELCQEIVLWQNWLVSSQTQHKQFSLNNVADAVEGQETVGRNQDDANGVWYSFTNFNIALTNLSQSCFPRGMVSQRLKMLLDLIQHGFQRQVRDSTGPHRLRPEGTNTFGHADRIAISEEDSVKISTQQAMNIYEVLMHPKVVDFLNPKKYSHIAGGSIVGGGGGSQLRTLFTKFTDAFSGRNPTFQGSQVQSPSTLRMNAVAWMELIEASGMLGVGFGRVSRTDALGVFNITVSAAKAAQATALAVQGISNGDDQYSSAGSRGLTLQMFAEAMARVAMTACQNQGVSASDELADNVVNVLRSAVATANKFIHNK